MSSSTHYEILGVARDATDDEIKSVYRRLARELHPDHHPNDMEKEGRFKEVTAAYEVLGAPERRRAYDQQLAAEEARAAQEAADNAAEAARRWAEEFSRITPRAPTASPPCPVAPTGSGFPWGELLEGLAKVGIAALIYGGLSGNRSRWDPVVDRRRGPDGRFRRSRRVDRRRRSRRRSVR